MSYDSASSRSDGLNHYMAEDITNEASASFRLGNCPSLKREKPTSAISLNPLPSSYRFWLSDVIGHYF